MSCKLYIKNNRQSKEKNLQLLKFLTNNVQELVDSGYTFHIIKVSSKNLDELHRQGVTGTPALKLKNKCPVIGSNAIIKFLISMCEDEKIDIKSKSKVSKKIDDEDSSDYVKDMLLEIIQDYEEEEEEDSAAMKANVRDRLNSRQSPASADGRVSMVDARRRADDSDEELMNMYWDNLKETDI
jgi:hypothetical protein